MKIGFIGAGRVGFSLGKFFEINNVHVIGYYSRNIESAVEAANFTKSKAYNNSEALIKDCDAIFLTVPDRSISQIYNKIKNYGIDNKYICHCSGALSSKDAFCDIKDYGAYGFSIHPLFPVSSKYTAYKELKGAFFCLEGDERKLGDWLTLFENTGCKTQVISAKEKVKYHAACTISSNLVCGLVFESVKLLCQCGFDEKTALQALTPLINGNAFHITESSPVEALTGPLERNDFETVQKHIDALEDKNAKNMYIALSKIILTTAKEKHKDFDYSSMESILK